APVWGLARDLAPKKRFTLKNEKPLNAVKTTLSVNGPPSSAYFLGWRSGTGLCDGKTGHRR
ncbi:hypothetical protein, partial [Mesotoga sp. HF07.pep.5.2.highcov]|uniref:hypothetical protein n=1 Tax=Mesotoga sp. HF07.pep.5.2.highcov TaxID=1462923 RepID=UPI001C7D36A6